MGMTKEQTLPLVPLEDWNLNLAIWTTSVIAMHVIIMVEFTIFAQFSELSIKLKSSTKFPAQGRRRLHMEHMFH